MRRPGDIEGKIERHLRSAWGRTLLCTTQEVREALTASLLGVRSKLDKPLSKAELLALRERCRQVHDQLRLLLSRRDFRHGRMLRRVLRSYERRVEALLESFHEGADPPRAGGSE